MISKSQSNKDKIMNVLKMAKTVFILIMFLHLTAILNCWVGMAEGGWILKDENNEPLESTWTIYVTQYYFITSTMTTVGYGDHRAKHIKDSSTQYDGNNIIFVMMLQFGSMAVFGKVKQTLKKFKFRKSSH